MTQLKVRDVMTTQVVSLKGTDTVKQATVKLAVNGVSGAPVIDSDHKMIGMFSETDILELVLRYQTKLNLDNPSLHILTVPMDLDIPDENLRAASKEISETLVRDLMAKTVLTTTPDANIVDVVKAMIEKDVNRIPVLEKGVLVGIISRGDVIFSIYKRKA